MSFLNYHHLMYFWTVAREGGVARAAEKLHLSSPTISAQIHELEEMLNEKLFERRGRSLVLTEMGQFVFKYADEIFTLGRELMDAVKLGPNLTPTKLNIGIADGVPKLLSLLLLDPVIKMDPPMCIVEQEGKPDRLFAELATYRLDVVISDMPIGAGMQIRAYNHLLAECGVSFIAGKALYARFSKNFPACLDGAPMYLPTRNTALRRSLDQYFDQHDIHPRILGEFEDSALLKTFGTAGRALFPVPALIADTVCDQYDLKDIGTLESVRERFYAISPERKLKHPAVVAICAGARKELFR